MDGVAARANDLVAVDVGEVHDPCPSYRDLAAVNHQDLSGVQTHS